MKLATWSGPRNISTAMMRAWENRADCVVSDEPFYAAWLAASGADHPSRERIIADGQIDSRRVVAELTGPNPQASPLWYQKHMCHHITADMDLDWLADLDRHVFLIRRPEQVVASYIRARGTEDISAEDVGLPRQLELFEWISKHSGHRPPVIDSSEFLAAPEAHLKALCRHIGITFDPAMLNWPAGPRKSDGIWAPDWYDSVWRSTGFQPARSQQIRLTGQPARVASQCQELYQALYEYRLPCRV